jgi:hypothetical protein
MSPPEAPVARRFLARFAAAVEVRFVAADGRARFGH